MTKIKSKEYISPRQLFSLTTGFLLGTAIILSMGMTYAHRATWIAELITLFLTAAVLIMLSLLLQKHPGKYMPQILNTLLPPLLAKVLLIYFILIGLLLSALVLNNIQRMINVAVMRDTPMWVFALTMILTTGYVVRQGLESSARCAELLIPLVLLLLTFLYVAVSFNIRLEFLLPVWTIKPLDMVKAVLLLASFPGAEVILLCSPAAHVQERRKILPALLLSLLVAGAFLVLRPILAIGVFGFQEAVEYTFPIIEVARTIQLGTALERVEIFLLFTWFCTAFIKLAVAVFTSLKGIAALFNLPDIKALVFPFCIFLFPLGLNAYSNYTDVIRFTSLAWPLLTLPFSFLVLPLLLLLSFIKKPRAKAGKKPE